MSIRSLLIAALFSISAVTLASPQLVVPEIESVPSRCITNDASQIICPWSTIVDAKDPQHSSSDIPVNASSDIGPLALADGWDASPGPEDGAATSLAHRQAGPGPQKKRRLEIPEISNDDSEEISSMPPGFGPGPVIVEEFPSVAESSPSSSTLARRRHGPKIIDYFSGSHGVLPTTSA